MSTLWAGRMSSEPAPEMMEFSQSLSFDIELAEFDILGSEAHVKGLENAGILTAEESNTLMDALKQTAAELLSGEFVVQPADEDIHTAVERRVTQLAGKTGEKLHTGRSRNDQVATDMRLYAKANLADIATVVLQLQEALLERALQSDDAILPGYTHLQRAQVVPLAHYLLAHGWALARDFDRLLGARERLDVSPLGAGALGGSSLPLNPKDTATELGFSKVFDNSLDAVSDRDFVAESLFVLSLLGVHLSRLGEEVVFYSSQEVGFFQLHDSYATGSSMLPHKKNPDVAELVRGKSGRLIGNLTGLLATLKALPLAYNRDLQEDKEPLFDSFKQVRMALVALTGLISTLQFDKAAMAVAASDPTLAAVDLADFLVRKGVPFREAHKKVAKLVAASKEANAGVSEELLPLKQLVLEEEGLGAEAAKFCDVEFALAARQTSGGAGPAAVEEQMKKFAKQLKKDRALLEQL